ncbi:MAG TPA: WecB/TagA/CpsF family glycosyltransferase [Candidatus Bathyarchaeia archaeon]|nr:WecB/TagA/CpsF family glycosyltransferase [Candidatus Bathyarchaeia archaeon]
MEPFTFEMGYLRCSTHTIPQLLLEVRMLLRDKTVQPRTILCVNAHIYNLAFSDVSLRQALNEARIVTADGMGIVMAAPLFGKKIPERCNMTEAFRAFLESDQMPGSRGVLLGVTEREVALTAHNIEQLSSHCRILEAASGFCTDAEYERILAAHKNADFVFLGMGSPKTERISKLASAICTESIVWSIGAGTMKIIAGTLKEAPVLMRRYSLQWLHRLYLEPRIMWRRYLIGNPLFAIRVVGCARKQRKTGG